MKRALLCLCCLAAACVDPQSAETKFCDARPELCPRDAGEFDAGTDAGPVDAGTDAGTDGGADAGADAGTDAGPTCPRNDEFDGTTWNSCFTNYEPLTSDPVPRVENGSLVFDQYGPDNGWSLGNGGSLLSQQVTGNFVAEVRARLVVPQRDGGPFGIFTAAALIAVDPQQPTVNSRLVSVGSLDVAADGGLSFGVLSEMTQNRVSTYQPVENGATEALLRLCRVDAGWFAYTRAVDGGTWSGFQLFALDSGFTLPDTVLVGPAAYAVGAPSARIEHDYFRINRAVGTQTECATAPTP